MTVRVGISGLGRIGRLVLRHYIESGRDDVEIVAVNASGEMKRHAHMLKYDSVHGVFRGEVKFTDGSLDMGRGVMKRFSERDPSKIDWAGAGIDIVLECTGKFKTHADASLHLKGGAKKVIISAPSPDPDSMVVYGVNNEVMKPEDAIISIGSCTTGCLAPVVKVLHNEIGIESGFMTTIHSYTNDQNILDAGHKDLRRARAGALSMIPSSTGAAKAIGRVLPELQGKIDGCAIRVPTPNVSLVDLTFNASRETTVDEINVALQNAADGKTFNGEMKGVLEVCDEELVSVDYNGNPHSSIFDTTGTRLVGGKLCRVAAWYDNEWGFSVRMLDVTAMAAKMAGL